MHQHPIITPPNIDNDTIISTEYHLYPIDTHSPTFLVPTKHLTAPLTFLHLTSMAAYYLLPLATCHLLTISASCACPHLLFFSQWTPFLPKSTIYASIVPFRPPPIGALWALLTKVHHTTVRGNNPHILLDYAPRLLITAQGNNHIVTSLSN